MFEIESILNVTFLIDLGRIVNITVNNGPGSKPKVILSGKKIWFKSDPLLKGFIYLIIIIVKGILFWQTNRLCNQI